MPSYYKSIDGWFNFERVYCNAIERARDGDIFVEIGAWKGKSTCFMAELIMESGKSVKFYAVDTWAGDNGDALQDGKANSSEDSIYSQFQSNIEAAGVSSFVTPVASSSSDASSGFADGSIDFIFVDGDHSEDAVYTDLTLWYPKLKPGGVIAGHDYDNPGVRNAVTRFFAEKGRHVTPHDEEHWGHCWQVGMRDWTYLPGKGNPDYGRIFDCFTFYDELDILEIRLNELEDIVDVFVICECPFDFRGRPKPLTFLENKERFARWLPSIRHITAARPPLQVPDTKSVEVWDNEGYQRNSIGIALDDCSPGDIIVVSDVDEIPSKDALRRVSRDGKVTQIVLDVFHYNLNWHDVNNTWYVQDVRAVSYGGFSLANGLRTHPPCYTHRDGGWHFTWFGGAGKIAQKATWYSHPILDVGGAITTDGNTPILLVEGKQLTWTDNLASLPRTIQDDLPRWKHLFDPKFVSERPELFGVSPEGDSA